MQLYNLHKKIHNECLYMKIRRGMYCLPQAGAIANKMLKDHLAKYGYYEVPHTPGLYKHYCRPIQFTLIVDDFGVKYTRKEDLQHLLNSLKNHYDIEVDLSGKIYEGIHLDWNYDAGYVDIAMIDHVKKQLLKYNHPMPSRKQDSPFPIPHTRFGKASQELPEKDETPILNEKDKKIIQQVTGSFLYYGRAVDPTIVMALSTIASQQSAPTENTMKLTKHFLDYMATHPDAKIRYYKSDMILNIHSDASYLTEPKARSRIAGHFFMASIPQPDKPIRLNGAIHSLCTILKHVAASAAEAELGALFSNARIGTIMRLTLYEMGHPQPPTPIHTDNLTAAGISNSTVKLQRSRAMDMRYFWIVDQVNQNNINVEWHPGLENLADYTSKHHSAKIHRYLRPYYLQTKNSPRYLTRALKPSKLRGYVKTPNRVPIHGLITSSLNPNAHTTN